MVLSPKRNLTQRKNSCWGCNMPFHHLKISDCGELLKKHYLNCDIRSVSYLERVAEQGAIKDAVDNGWLTAKTVKDELCYCLTPKGSKLVNGNR